MARRATHRRPVLVIPGIGGTYAADANDDLAWLIHRGVEPEALQIDPLAVPPAGVTAALDHFLCYKANTTKGTTKFDKILGVDLTDQFETGSFDVKKPVSICNPAGTDGAEIVDPATHLQGYQIKEAKYEPKHVPQTNTKVDNQFGTIFVDTTKPDRLLAPTAKDLDNPVDPPDSRIDHFKCYTVKAKQKICEDDPTVQCKTDADCAIGTCNLGFPEGIQVTLDDQFPDTAKVYDVIKPTRLCTPVEKKVDEELTEIKNPDTHLRCYQVKPAKGAAKHTPVLGIHTNNQFGPEQLDTIREEEICVPSTKTVP